MSPRHARAGSVRAPDFVLALRPPHEFTNRAAAYNGAFPDSACHDSAGPRSRVGMRAWEIPFEPDSSRRQQDRRPLSTGCPRPLPVPTPRQPGSALVRGADTMTASRRGHGPASFPDLLARCWTAQKHTVDRADVNLSCED